MRRSRDRSGSPASRAGAAGPARPSREDERARRSAPASHLRQPEPRVQRGQHEDERERVRCQNEQRDETEREQRDGLAGEQLLGADRASRHEPLARRRATRAEQRERTRSARAPASCRPPATPGSAVARRRRARRRSRRNRRTRARRRARSRAGCGARRAAGPSGIRRRRQCAKRSTAPTKNGIRSAGEQQLDRPAADDARAGPDVARRPLGQLEALVERAEQLLRGAPESCEVCAVERRRAGR